MDTLIDLFLHLDQHLAAVTATYGPWIYGLLFLIVFAETGLVVTPILPGDSLLFAAGALAATGALNPMVVVVVLLVAAVAGDAVNYAVGRAIGPRIFTAHDASSLLHRLLNRDHLTKAHAFFEKYGGKAVVFARFVPIARTFCPVVAGIARMRYRSFLAYNIIGGVGWGAGLVLAGYFLASIVPNISERIHIVIAVVVVLSFMPPVIAALRDRAARSRASRPLRTGESPDEPA